MPDLANGGEKAPRDPLAAVIQALSGFGGLAAAILGGLYLAGILIKTVQLMDADLSVQATLPLFPLEQILRTAIAIVGPGLAVLAVAGALLLISYLYEQHLSELTKKFEKGETAPDDAKRKKEWAAAVDKAKGRRSWQGIKKEVAIGITESGEAGDDERLKRLRAFRRALRLWDWWGVLLLVGLVAGAAFFLTPLVFVVCLFVGTWVLSSLENAPVERQVGAFYLVLLLGIIATVLTAPQPLPRATVVTDDEGAISGDFVLISDANWYVGVDGALRAIPSDHILCARIEHTTRPKRVGEVVFGSGEPDLESLPALHCPNPDRTMPGRPAPRARP